MGARLEAGLGHAFAQAALADEGFVERAQEAVEEEVGWVNEADGHVGDDLAGARLRERAIEVKGLGFLRPRMFCFPERVAWIIGSTVRSPLARCLWAKWKVRS
jgi:hypothetical protein